MTRRPGGIRSRSVTLPVQAASTNRTQRPRRLSGRTGRRSFRNPWPLPEPRPWRQAKVNSNGVPTA